MSDKIILEEITDESLDAVLALAPEQKLRYFSSLVQLYYPSLEVGSERYNALLETYVSSFYIEKLYRNNRFFNEKFTPVYTDTGLIRNIIADIFYTDDHLITH
jgi:hypothetical protein